MIRTCEAVDRIVLGTNPIGLGPQQYAYGREAWKAGGYAERRAASDLTRKGRYNAFRVNRVVMSIPQPWTDSQFVQACGRGTGSICVDVSQRQGEWTIWIGFWISASRRFSIPARSRTTIKAEGEAVRLAKALFPDRIVFSDHKGVAREFGAHYLPRKLNVGAHRTANLRSNPFNCQRKAGLPSRKVINEECKRSTGHNRAGNGLGI